MPDIKLATGEILRVEAVLPAVFRIRLGVDDHFAEPGLVRYGIVRSDWPPVPCEVIDSGGQVLVRTGEATLEVERADGRVSLRDASGRLLVAQSRAPRPAAHAGFELAFALGPDEHLYGHGDETRERIDKRGHRGMMAVRNVVSYAPIPFLMSTGGWAVFVNSTWLHNFDAGATDPNELRIWGERGALDYYLMAGANLPELLDRYTQITGRPCLLPLWGYGLTFVCDDRGVRARDVLYEAHMFRREDMPCDVIGLEPYWMEKHYDYSVDKRWSEERFHFPFWLPGTSPGGFPAALNNMGFKLSLWLCCDYDLSEYEERLLGAADAEPQPHTAERSADDLIHDPHFDSPERRFDNITRPGEPWFQHLRKFVADGARAFKMDGANQVHFHPDRKWYNGMDDDEMHNLYPVLLAKQMSLGYREHTGRRAMIYTACGYAGVQQFAATWAGDTGGGEKPLVSLLNHGLSGHANTSCDMQVWSPEGIHFGFLQPWCQILSWHQYNQPWFLGRRLEGIFRFYAKLRYRLLPYFYSAAHVAARTGLPIMRAMPLAAPDDPRSPELLHQYMLGDFFLTCAFTDSIHLPAGQWVDYWTGERHEGPKDLPVCYPEGRGGPLFVRAGAIIPTWPPMQYVGDVPLDRIGLEVFAGESSRFTLYEDDGETLGYLEGQVAETEITCERSVGEIVLTISPRRGEYAGMPEQRYFDLMMHLDAAPSAVQVNGELVAEGASGWCYQDGALLLAVHEDPARQQPVVVRIRE